MESCNSIASETRWPGSNFNLALTSCVGSGKLLHFSEPPIPPLKNGRDNGTCLLMLG